MGVGTGFKLTILEKLVGNLGSVVTFQQLDKRSYGHEGSEVIRRAIKELRRIVRSKGIPAKIENRKRIGYILLSTPR